jgi:hypothetical protein
MTKTDRAIPRRARVICFRSGNVQIPFEPTINRRTCRHRRLFHILRRTFVNWGRGIAFLLMVSANPPLLVDAATRSQLPPRSTATVVTEGVMKGKPSSGTLRFDLAGTRRR